MTAARELYVSDVDHTLLGSDGSLSNYSRETLNRLLADGMLFTVASARSCASLRPLLAGLALSLPVVEVNGAFVSDLASGRHHLVNALAPAVLGDLWELLGHSGQIPFISTYDGTADRLYYHTAHTVANAGVDWYLQDRRRYRDPRLCRLANLRDALREQVICLTVIGRQRELQSLRREIRRRHDDTVRTYCFENQYSPGWHWLTVHDTHATKERGVAALLQLDGWQELQGRRLVVFGDGANDLGLFRTADAAFAVANAEPDLKRHATAVIAANDADGVARYLSNRHRAQTRR